MRCRCASGSTTTSNFKRHLNQPLALNLLTTSALSRMFAALIVFKTDASPLMVTLSVAALFLMALRFTTGVQGSPLMHQRKAISRLVR